MFLLKSDRGSSDHRAIDPDQLSQLIANVYDTVLEPELWQVAIERACAFVGTVAGSIFWQDAVDQSATFFHIWGDDPHYTKLYLDKYIRLNPFLPATTFVEPGIVFSGSDLVPYAEYRETLFFKEWVQPQGFVEPIVVNLQRYATSAAHFVLVRGEQHGLADAEAIRRMELLAPHVRRAVLIGREIDRQRAKSATLEAVLSGVAAGVFLVGPAGQLSLANDPGRGMLDRGDVLVERGGVLAALDRQADRVLRDAIARAGAADDLVPNPVSIALTQGDGPRWLAHVLPLSSGARLKATLGYEASAAVFVRKAELPVASGLETVAKVNRLTPSEIRVLEAVVTSGSVDDIAETLGLSVGTVKTHLGSLFVKTGTKRRAELIKAVAAHGSPLA